MNTRREFLAITGALAAVVTTVRAQETCAVLTKATQAATTPEQALARLKEGNGRFVSGKTLHCDPRMQVKDTAMGQAPFAAVLGCMDSRVAPELVFDQQIGSIFGVRIAGNFVTPEILGSLEYAAKVVGARLIVVLGHSDCGAVKGAIDDVKLGNLTTTLSHIRPAVMEVTKASGAHNSKNKEFVQSITNQNAKDAAAMLTAHSEILADLVAKHDLQIASAMHDVGTGVVTWLT